MASALTAAQLAKLAKLSHLQSLAARTKQVTDNLKTITDSLDSRINSLNGSTVKTVDISKKATANTGYAASYQLLINGTALETEINIPKDFLVKSASLGVCEAENVPLAGLAVGDPYLDFVVNTKNDGDSATVSDQHIYINVKDLVDTYTPGNGIDITNNVVSLKIDSTAGQANGLAVGAHGLALGLATDSTAGAMSATDHAQFTADSTKLADVSAQANKTTVSSEGSGIIEIDGLQKTVVEIAADADVLTMLNEELPLSTPSGGE